MDSYFNAKIKQYTVLMNLNVKFVRTVIFNDCVAMNFP